MKSLRISCQLFLYHTNYLSGVGEQDNTPIAVNEITKIVIDAKDTNGNTLDPVTINRGSANGEFDATTGAGGASGYIIELYIKAAPTAPTDDDLLDDPDIDGDLAILGENAVKVTCTNSKAEHEAQTYGLIANTNGQKDSYTIGAVTALAGGGYTCTITVRNGPYVAKYGGDHTLAENEPESQNIVLTWDSDSNTWNALSTLPVNFNVICDTEPGGGEEPSVPGIDDIEQALEGNIEVACSTNTEHEMQNYGYVDGAISDLDSAKVEQDADGSYICKLTLDTGKYVGRYNEKYSVHTLVDPSTPVIITLHYTEKDGTGTWYMEAPVTINVKCDSGTTDPEDPEKPTLSEDDVVTMLGTNAIAVKCIDDKHITQYHPLENTIVSLGNVTGSKETGYQCDVTVTLDIGNLSSYLAAYNEFTTPQKHSLMSMDTITRTITLKCEPNDEVDWYFPGECPIITIDVTCASGETTIPAPDDETVNNLLGKAVIIDCTNDEANHENEAFSLIEDTYQIGEVYMADDIPHCNVTITGPDKYAAQYSHNTNTNHPLAPAVQVSQAITLKYVNDEWAIDDDGTVYYTVACEDTSTEPTPTPTPTPTPDPGDDDNPPYIPPYIPPVDPDDSGVSDLLNTDDHIQYLFGYPEGTFGPENNMTRAEVAQMFYNLLLDQDVTITKTFDDVPANAWYAKAVNTLASLGVVSGVGNGDFEPERSITRAEFTSIAMKFAEGKTGGTNIFSDVKSTDWFYRAVVNSTQYGWIHGYGDGTFRPNNPITRVEVTAIVNNMLGREADVDFVTEHYDELNHFSDLAVSHWGYYHIVEATNDHDYTKPSSGENWTELN